jgi:hypothetical protein
MTEIPKEVVRVPAGRLAGRLSHGEMKSVPAERLVNIEEDATVVYHKAFRWNA